jgi:hypothetical protein
MRQITATCVGDSPERMIAGIDKASDTDGPAPDGTNVLASQHDDRLERAATGRHDGALVVCGGPPERRVGHP